MKFLPARSWCAAVLIAVAPVLLAQDADEARPRPKSPAAAKPPRKKKKRPAGPVLDILTTTKAELARLPEMNEALAEKIIAGRPYKTKADLVSRNILVMGQYLMIKDRISVGKPRRK